MARPDRKTARLRFGRRSIPGAIYFVTFCTKDRRPVLSVPNVIASILGILRSMGTTQDIGLIAACVMPDHLHLLFALGPSLQVGQVVGKIKSLSRPRDGIPWRWQDEAFERQLRPDDAIEDYAFYIFMNPYRAGLCPCHEIWPGWLCPKPELLGFLAKLNPGHVVPKEWIGLSREIASKIVVRG